MGIRIITDSASDIPDSLRAKVDMVPMTIRFGDVEYRDRIDLTNRQFYQRLIESDELPSTSQVNPAQFAVAFRRAVDAGDSVVCITLATELSGTYESACAAAEGFPGKVFVVDSTTAAIGEAILVERALELVEQTDDAAEVAETLIGERKDIRLIALLDTLEYLWKGGRLPRTVALAGNLLAIKPVIALRNGKIELLGKAHGSRNANNLLVKQIEKSSGIDFSRPHALGFTGLSDDLLQKYLIDSAKLWADYTNSVPIYPVGATIGTHAGPGAIAVAYFSPKQ